MIKIENYNKNKGKISFFTDMSLSLANAIRRSVLEIPVMAIDEVEISKNDSALYDEIIAHRLGLVPIKTSKLSKQTKFKLDVKGPKTVYSTDLSPSIGTEYALPIVILNEEQELKLVATTNLGTAIEHIKYSPGLIFYRHNLDSTIIDFVSVSDNGKINYNEDELKGKNLPEELISKIKKVSLSNELLMNIESWGQIEVKEIFSKAIEVLDKNLKELNKAVK